MKEEISYPDKTPLFSSRFADEYKEFKIEIERKTFRKNLLRDNDTCWRRKYFLNFLNRYDSLSAKAQRIGLFPNSSKEVIFEKRLFPQGENLFNIKEFRRIR